MVKEFLERNKPVFTIGLITLLVFVLIIIYSLLKPYNTTSLVKLSYDTPYIIEETQSEDPIIQELTENTVTYDDLIEPKTVLYNDKGFIPKNLRVSLGQLIIWKNETNSTIYIVQKTPKYKQLYDPVQIEPGQTFEFRMIELGMWTYEERDTKKFGSVLVEKNTITP